MAIAQLLATHDGDHWFPWFPLIPLFFIVFFGTAVASFVLAVATFLHMPRSGAPLLLAGSALYLAGTVGVTMMFHVPLDGPGPSSASTQSHKPASA